MKAAALALLLLAGCDDDGHPGKHHRDMSTDDMITVPFIPCTDMCTTPGTPVTVTPGPLKK